MKRAWGWILVIGLIVAILMALNYKGKQKNKSLSEIFPEEGSPAANVQYEFVKKEAETTNAALPAVSSQTTVLETSIKKAATTTVAVKPAVSAATKTENQVIKTTGTVFALQVASFKEEARAKIILDALKKKDYTAYLTTRDLKEKGIWYRVYVGNFDTKAKADEILAKIKDIYKESFVTSLNQR